VCCWPCAASAPTTTPVSTPQLKFRSQRSSCRCSKPGPNPPNTPGPFSPTPYPIHQLSGQPQPEADPPRQSCETSCKALLGRIQPQALVTVGWADQAYQSLLVLGQQRRIPVVLISDSRQRDESRSPSKEWLKRQLLRGYSAALVAGQESRAYLTGLGFPPVAIQQPWDVVDNAFFAQAAANAGPRQPRFLCVSRLVAKKNHATLLEAYGAYQHQGGSWGLQLVGSGPMEPTIQAQIASLPDPSRIQLLPFGQLEDLGRLYGQASAFVLASSSDQWGLVVNEAIAAGLPCLVSSACGCAVDLIDHGHSGWCFQPDDAAQLANLLHSAERQRLADRLAMVAAARLRLEAFSPARFAHGLARAVDHALTQPRFSRRAALAAQLLARR
jgi:glycosyltransferase involved in cell wall biosynthesis